MDLPITDSDEYSDDGENESWEEEDDSAEDFQMDNNTLNIQERLNDEINDEINDNNNNHNNNLEIIPEDLRASKKAKISQPPQAPFFVEKTYQIGGAVSSEQDLTVKRVSDNYLLLCATFYHLYLFDKDFKQLNALYHGLPRAASPNLANFERLSILLYIPELSVVVAASQGSCSVLICRICRNLSTMTYSIEPEIRLPELLKEDVPIAGMTYAQFKTVICGKLVEVFRLFILFHSGSLLWYDLRRCE